MAQEPTERLSVSNKTLDDIIACTYTLELENLTLKTKLALYEQMYGPITIQGEDTAPAPDVPVVNG